MKRVGIVCGATGTVASILAVALAWSAPATSAPCPAFCGGLGGPRLLTLRSAGGNRVRLSLLLSAKGPAAIVVSRALGAHLARIAPTAINQQPREVLIGHIPVGGRRKTVVHMRLRSFSRGTRTRTVNLGKRLAAGVYVVTVNSATGKGKIRAAGSSIVMRVTSRGGLSSLLAPYPAPSATTGGPGSVTQSSASVSGAVYGNGKTTHYFIQYGPATAYTSHTKSRRLRSKSKTLNVAVKLSGLSSGVVYHYRLVATSCGGCPSGTTYGTDQTVPTIATTTQQLDAERAVLAYNALQTYFYAPNVYPGDTSSLYAQSYPASQSSNRYSFLWPFSRVFAGTVALAGIPSSLLGGTNYVADANDRLTGLSRYWSANGYDSYPPAPYGNGGDKYYDDAGWVGFSAIQDYQLTGNPAALQDAWNVFNFAYPGGWAGGASFEPGGIYWVNQGVGVGVGNHDRTTNSTAPNAELAMLLASADPANAGTYAAAGANMYQWANHYLYNVDNPADPQGPNPNYDPTQPALMFDKVRGGGTIDKTLWTYNQGTMISASVREYQLTGQPAFLSEAEAIANTALSTFNESQYLNKQPPAFNAIFFSGLLELYGVTSNTALQSSIINTIQTYANDAWDYYRDAQNLFRLPSSQNSGYQLLDQGAMLEIYAMLAWNPINYGKLPHVAHRGY